MHDNFKIKAILLIACAFFAIAQFFARPGFADEKLIIFQKTIMTANSDTISIPFATIVDTLIQMLKYPSLLPPGIELIKVDGVPQLAMKIDGVQIYLYPFLSPSPDIGIPITEKRKHHLNMVLGHNMNPLRIFIKEGKIYFAQMPTINGDIYDNKGTFSENQKKWFENIKQIIMRKIAAALRGTPYRKNIRTH